MGMLLLVALIVFVVLGVVCVVSLLIDKSAARRDPTNPLKS